MVKYYAPTPIIGLCVAEIINNCFQYELLIDDTIECFRCRNKYIRAFDQNRLCVYYKNYAEFCLNYVLDDTN